MSKIERGKEKRRKTENGKNYEKMKGGCISRVVSDKQRQQRLKETQIIYYESMNNNYSIFTSFDAGNETGRANYYRDNFTENYDFLY